MSFHNCDLSEAQFYEAKLNNVDFSGARLDGIKIGALDLKGAIIYQQQAIEMAEQLANLLGLIVRRSKLTP